MLKALFDIPISVLLDLSLSLDGKVLTFVESDVALVFGAILDGL